MSTFKANSILLKTLLDEVENGSIRLPDFQRGWVWDDDRIKGLLVSISRGFPVGAVMTLDADGDVQFQSRLIEGVASNGDGREDQYLLDGQQRLTSLYQALRYRGPVETRPRPGRGRVIKRWYYIDINKSVDPLIDRDDTIFSVPEDRVVRSNFGRDVELDLSSPDREFENHMIPTEMVMDDSTEWLLGYIEHWQGREDYPYGHPATFFRQFKDTVLNNISQYQLPVINLGKSTPKEAVCTVFEKVNTGGVTLTVFELVTASFAAGGFSLRDDWKQREERLHSGYGVLQRVEGDHFLQAVALLATQERRKRVIEQGTPSNRAPGISCKRNAILNLALADYLRWADRVEASFVEAAKFLNKQFVYRASDVPYNTQLVPLAAISVELGRDLEPSNASNRLERWYWCGVFGETYGGNTETQFSLDLPEVSDYVRGGMEPTLVTQASFIPERLLSLSTRNSAAYKGLYALQMKSGAADWRTAEPLSFATWHNHNIDIHHVFPRAWCEGQDPTIPSSLYDSVINKTPIDATTNRLIGGRGPSRYLPRLRQDYINPDDLRRVLVSHWLDPELLEADNFGECFVRRGEEMLQLIGNAMRRKIPDGGEVFRNALKEGGYPDQFDDPEPEHDEIGDWAHTQLVAAG